MCVDNFYLFTVLMQLIRLCISNSIESDTEIEWNVVVVYVYIVLQFNSSMWHPTNTGNNLRK